MIFNQQEFNVRTEWGLQGVENLAEISDVVVIVDVLSFSTCVEIAAARGAFVYPYAWRDNSAVEFARSQNALVASHERRFTDGYSLSPSSLVNIPAATKIVLPSPNGSTLSLRTGNSRTVCGCLRNARAVAEYAMSVGGNIAVIPAGEKWEDGSLRFAFEDLLGAGAIIHYLKGNLSPESLAAKSLFETAKNQLVEQVKKCGSGKELIARGFERDVEIACEQDVSDCVPVLNGDFYEKASESYI